QERCEDAREDAVRVGVARRQAVERLLVGAGGEDDEGAARRLDPRQAAAQPDGPRAGGRRERIVAAGVDDRHLQSRAAAIDVVADAVRPVAKGYRDACEELL